MKDGVCFTRKVVGSPQALCGSWTEVLLKKQRGVKGQVCPQEWACGWCWANLEGPEELRSLLSGARPRWAVLATWPRTACSGQVFKKPIVSYCSIMELLPPTPQIVLKT